MSDIATAAAGQEPTAIQPERVLVLNPAEHRLLLDGLIDLAADDEAPGSPADRLYKRIVNGDEYVNPKDELVRTTLRKRRLEAEVRRCNQRIADVEQQVIDEFVEAGESGSKHAATGARLMLERKVWAKVAREGDKPTDEEKAAAAEGLIAAGLGDFVKPGFNTNTISAYFREHIKDYDADQKQLPEHERVPRDAASFLPPELKDLIELTDAPTVSVRA